ncbi:hypothetical protein WJX84_009856 [Apatococcus fuscideae]|uniref:Elongation factor Ts, mitochondrial n=1 Tax=Apatococcus fuscideae TaxID=2026836 RepID=A0AAW1SR78_9CHLO
MSGTSTGAAQHICTLNSRTSTPGGFRSRVPSNVTQSCPMCRTPASLQQETQHSHRSFMLRAAETEAAEADTQEISSQNGTGRGDGASRTNSQFKAVDLAVDQQMDGVVRGTTKFGVFVDVGADMDALVHISNLADGFISEPKDVVSPGDKMTVYIIKHQDGRLEASKLPPDERAAREERRASRGGRGRGDGGGRGRGSTDSQQTAGPGAFDVGRRGGGGARGGARGRGRGARAPIQLPEHIRPGEAIEGPIVTTTAYGCFVAVADGVRGMLRLAESTMPKGQDPDTSNGNDFFKVGDTIKAFVLEIQGDKVNLTQRTPEERNAEAKLEKGGVGQSVTGASGATQFAAAFAKIGVARRAPQKEEPAGPTSDTDAVGAVDPTPEAEPEGPLAQAQQEPRSLEDPKDPKPLDYAPSSGQTDSAALQESGQAEPDPEPTPRFAQMPQTSEQVKEKEEARAWSAVGEIPLQESTPIAPPADQVDPDHKTSAEAEQDPPTPELPQNEIVEEVTPEEAESPKQAQPAADVINATEEYIPEPASTSSSTEPGPLGESDAPAEHQQTAAELKPNASEEKTTSPDTSPDTSSPAGTTPMGSDATKDGRMPPPAGELSPEDSINIPTPVSEPEAEPAAGAATEAVNEDPAPTSASALEPTSPGAAVPESMSSPPEPQSSPEPASVNHSGPTPAGALVEPQEDAAAPPPAPAASSPAAASNGAAPAAKAGGAITSAMVKQLRDKSGAGMMDCKKALAECNCDVDKANDYLRKKGLISADKKAGRIASDGVVAQYIHAGSRLGVLVEVNCETDFVAKGDIFRAMAQDVAMQIAANADVEFVAKEDASEEWVEREKASELQKEDLQSKPENIRQKMVEGRVNKLVKEKALLEQAFIKDTSKTVNDLVKETTAQLGEKVSIRRISRFVLGEGLTKKSADLASEVEEQTKAMQAAAADRKVEEEAAPAPEPEGIKDEDVPDFKVSPKAVKELRDKSGAGMMDCKKALAMNQGDQQAAADFLRAKGLARADKKASRAATEGAIGAYIHAGSRLGVLLEVNCETDFVARGDKFKELLSDLAMQVAASPPAVNVVSKDDVPAADLDKEREMELQKEDLQQKPEHIRSKIVEGRVAKIVNERALLEQDFIKDPKKKVSEVIKESVAVIGENIQIRRFSRFFLGEGMEKRSQDFAAEVAAQTGQN